MLNDLKIITLPDRQFIQHTIRMGIVLTAIRYTFHNNLPVKSPTKMQISFARSRFVIKVVQEFDVFMGKYQN